MFTDAMKNALDGPLNRANVKERTQAGRKLSYIEGWQAIAEANRIFGFDGWTRETVDVRVVSERERKIGTPPKPVKDGWGVSYVAKVRVTAHGIVREGVGAGHGIDVDLGLAHESAIKEAETDALKRALMTFGNPFGLALYDKSQANVAVIQDENVEPSSDQLYMEQQRAKLASIATLDDATAWWAAEETNRKRLLSGDQRKELFDLAAARSNELAAAEDKQRAA